MGTPPPAPQGDAVPVDMPSQLNSPNASSDAMGKRKKIGIIVGSILGVILIVIAVLFLLPKEEVPIVLVKPSVADYIKGKRFTYSLPEEAIDGLIPTNLVAVLGGQINSIKAQLSSQPVFMQFGTNNIVEYGTSIKGSVAKITQGTYSVDGLSVMLAKDGGNDTAVFTKAEPGIGDEFNMKFVTGKDVKIKITNVEPAEPLQGMNMAMMGSLGLGGSMPPGGLAGLLPTGGLPIGSSQGKGKGKKGKGKKGKGQSQGQSQGRPQAGYPARKMQWTYGAGGRDLVGWKGLTMQQVHQSFGNPDLREDTPAGGEWQYNNMNITDAQGKPHQTVTFVYMVNGMVVDVLLRPLLPAAPKAVQ
ncbi:MAG: hypothetical protein QF406_06360 [Verrucomicrobiota bacterium]|nr:hypothetical protein [Verrucomicrobiota bacterium]